MTITEFTTLCFAVGCFALSACNGGGGSSSAPMPTTPPHAADPEAATPHTAKLIEFGWDMPSMTWLRDHSQALQQTPFDGVVLDLQSDATGAMDEQQLSLQVGGRKNSHLHAYANAGSR